MNAHFCVEVLHSHLVRAVEYVYRFKRTNVHKTIFSTILLSVNRKFTDQCINSLTVQLHSIYKSIAMQIEKTMQIEMKVCL